MVHGNNAGNNLLINARDKVWYDICMICLNHGSKGYFNASYL